MTHTIEVEGNPGLAGLFARAVATPRRGGAVPDTRVVRTDAVVRPGDLADYDRVCGFTLRDEIPPTLLHVLTFPLQVRLFAERDYPYSLLGSVHTENVMRLHRPVRVGEALSLTVRAAPARTHRRGATVDVHERVQVGAETVWDGVSTYLYRGAGVAGQAASGEDSQGSRQPDNEPIDGDGALWRLPGDLGRRYGAVSGDLNPIHLNPLAARAFGFPRTIAHGMWVQARALAALEGRLPAAYEARMSFRKPVLLPSTVRFVTGLDETTGRRRIAVRDNRSGAVHTSGDVGDFVFDRQTV